MKRQLIMEKALELFAQQGFHATSVQQITDFCGISKGAFYLSFKSKDELILALIDHFMMQYIADIDYTVKQTDNKTLLYKFYYTNFNSFLKHSDFAKLLIKEQTKPLNEELLQKMHYYDNKVDNSILTMIERLYGEAVTHTKFDLVYCIKGLMNTYAALFIFNRVPLDVELLSQSLVEKTQILAMHSTVPFITRDYMKASGHPLVETIPKEKIIELVIEKIEEIDDSTEKESLLLLKDHLIEPTLSPAIVMGLLENIQKNPHCKWIAYMLRNHFENGY